VKPTKERAATMLRARSNKFFSYSGSAPAPVEWPTSDEWRKELMELMEDVYYPTCKWLVRRDFVIGINRIVKGYLLNFIPGD
jgi:hypothetical protein